MKEVSPCKKEVSGMEGIGLSKTIYDRENGFRRVGLTEGEQQELLQQLRDLHVRIWRTCLEDAKSVIGKTAPSNLVAIACALFERRAPATYTVYQEFLGRKIYAVKNGNGGEKHD
jgi:hypothetical protein